MKCIHQLALEWGGGAHAPRHCPDVLERRLYPSSYTSSPGTQLDKVCDAVLVPLLLVCPLFLFAIAKVCLGAQWILIKHFLRDLYIVLDHQGNGVGKIEKLLNKETSR